MAVIFNILMVIFSVFSIIMLIPVLQFILENTLSELVPPLEWTGIADAGDWAKSHMNFWVAKSVSLEGQWPVLKKVLLFGAITFVLKNVFRYIAAIFMVYLRNGVSRDIRADIHDTILVSPIQEISKQRKGDLITRLTSDVQEVESAMLGSIQRLIQDPLMIILTLWTMVVISQELTVFAVVFIPVVGIIISWIGSTLKKSSTLLRSESGKIVSFFEEHINGLNVIKSFVAEKSASLRFNLSNNKVFRYANAMMFRNELASPASEALGSLIIIGIMAYGGYLIITENKLEP